MTSERDGDADVTDKTKSEVYRAIELGTYEKLTECKHTEQAFCRCTVAYMYALNGTVLIFQMQPHLRRQDEVRSGATSGSKQSHSSTIPLSEKSIANMYIQKEFPLIKAAAVASP